MFNVVCNLNDSNATSKLVNCYPGVVNLSDTILTDAEMSLLGKGLTFVDTPEQPDLGILAEDLNKFHLSIKRHLALPKFLETSTDRPNSDSNTTTPFSHSKFKNPSKWNPPCPMTLGHMGMTNAEELLSPNPETNTHKRYNLTKEERSAKQSLFKNKNIVIKKADKGSAVVVQNQSDYLREGFRQLSDRNFYRLQEGNLTSYHNDIIREEVERMVNSKEISRKTADYLIIENPKTANFYLLPKIHKNIIPPPGRPIVSANSCPSERISQFVDHFIQPLVKELPSYLRDSSHLINLIKDLRIPNDSILATLDVTSLYTNIPNDEGIEAIGGYLSRYRHHSLNPTNYSLRKLLELVLTTNNFKFDNKDFLQVGGTAMGTKLAPSFANLFMGYFEEKFIYSYRLQPLLWKRFIDDIFFIWTYGEKELLHFVKYLNNCHTTIKFTLETSLEIVNFLDIKIKKKADGTISTDLYCKPTDSHNYLLYSSEHPRHLLKGIPYSQFLRVKRICSDQGDFVKNAYMLAGHFVRRGYPIALVTKALERAEKLERSDLLDKQLLSSNNQMALKPQGTKTFYCITTHNPKNPPIREVITTNWEILGKTKTTRPLLDSNIVFGLRRNKNLSDQLVRASTSQKDEQRSPLAETRPCNKIEKCRYCPLLNTTGKFICKTNGKTYINKTKINCHSSNIIYLITCRSCGIQYVGQTKNKLLTRFQSHHFDISHNNDTIVARHFSKCPKHNPAKFSGMEISILNFIHAPPNSRASQDLRDIEEKRWIHRLASVVPRGLNLLD